MIGNVADILTDNFLDAVDIFAILLSVIVHCPLGILHKSYSIQSKMVE